MRQTMSATEFVKKFGKKEIIFWKNYKGTKRYKVKGDDESVLEFVTKSMQYEFTTHIFMEGINAYIKDPIEVFNNEGDKFTVYRVKVER